MKQYFRNDKGYSYKIASNESEKLITFGINANDDNEEKNSKDITLYKSNCSSGYCKQDCYEYSDQQFALTNKCHFNIKRIIVYQLN